MLAKRHSGIFKQIFARLQSHNCIFPNKWDEDQEAIRGRRQWPVDPRFGAFPKSTHEANPRSVRKEAAVPAASGKHHCRHFFVRNLNQRRLAGQGGDGRVTSGPRQPSDAIRTTRITSLGTKTLNPSGEVCRHFQANDPWGKVSGCSRPRPVSRRTVCDGCLHSR